MNQPMDVLQEFPVRKNKKQKTAFLDAVCSYGETLGYPCRVERGSFGARNLVMGDPEHADYLITAHYDTCANMVLPNFITPCNLFVYLFYQFLLVAIMGVLSVAVGVSVSLLLKNPGFGVLFAELALFGMIILIMVGPANRTNANDNTSGVVTVLETARSMPQALRAQVCFVLFDLEEVGLVGSSAYRKAHKKSISRQIVLNADCVGDGDEIVLFPNAAVKKDYVLSDRLKECAVQTGNKQIYPYFRFGFYPSDQAGFPKGIGIAALKRSKLVGLYMNKIHTKRDTILDEENVMILRNYLIRLIDNTQVG